MALLSGTINGITVMYVIPVQAPGYATWSFDTMIDLTDSDAVYP